MAGTQFAVGLVGPGRVGSVLAAGLRERGVVVVGYAAHRSGPTAAMPSDVPRMSLEGLVDAGPGVLLLTVGDTALAQVADRLAAVITARGRSAGELVAWHVSGRYGPAVLQPLGEVGVALVAGAPAMTFTGEPGDLERLPGTTWALTPGSARAKDAVADLITVLEGVLVHVAATDRPRYHAALSLASNHLGTIQRSAAHLLRSIGLTDPAAVLRPLAEAALADAWDDRPRFTGPVSRGDADAVTMHLDAIAHPPAEHTQDEVALYRALIRATVVQARAAGVLSADDAARIVHAVLAAARTDDKEATR